MNAYTHTEVDAAFSCKFICVVGRLGPNLVLHVEGTVQLSALISTKLTLQVYNSFFDGTRKSWHLKTSENL